jgi:hypothetical protein
MSISIGLSFMANDKRPLSQARQHDEGRRILALLDHPSMSRSSIQTEASGRPYFADYHADFSISHSRSMVAVSYCPARHPDTGKLLRTGCDIQYVAPTKLFHGVANRFFAPPERDYIQGAATQLEQNIRFCRIWTLKECFIKLRGLSIADIACAPAFDLSRAGDDFQAGLFRYDAEGFAFFQLIYGDNASGIYVLAVARESGGGDETLYPPEPTWVSAERLPLYTRNS